MENITYRLDQFEGPLDLLLTLIQKNKVNINDIPVALICDQYMEYMRQAEMMDMEIASEFIVMASDLMLMKSRMLLPKAEVEEEDPRVRFANAILRYQQIKGSSKIFAARYPIYSERMEKDTDEISVDRTFVANQDMASLSAAIRRLIAYNEEIRQTASVSFSPMISTPIVPVEVKIVGIIRHIRQKGTASLEDLLMDSVSKPDMIAIFLGILELIKVGQIQICSEEESDPDSIDSPNNALHNIRTRFKYCPHPVHTPEDASANQTEIPEES